MYEYCPPCSTSPAILALGAMAIGLAVALSAQAAAKKKAEAPAPTPAPPPAPAASAPPRQKPSVPPAPGELRPSIAQEFDDLKLIIKEGRAFAPLKVVEIVERRIISLVDRHDSRVVEFAGKVAKLANDYEVEIAKK